MKLIYFFLITRYIIGKKDKTIEELSYCDLAELYVCYLIDILLLLILALVLLLIVLPVIGIFGYSILGLIVLMLILLMIASCMGIFWLIVLPCLCCNIYFREMLYALDKEIKDDP